MQWKRWSLIGGIAVSTTACPVFSSHSVGDDVPGVKLEDWAGTWALGNGEPTYLFEIDDAAPRNAEDHGPRRRAGTHDRVCASERQGFVSELR